MKTKTSTDIQKKATEFLTWFECKTRDNGEKFLTMKDGHPEIVQDLVRKAHCGMLPDDYKYDYVVDALEAILAYDNPDDITSEMEPDAYNSELLKWLGSNMERAGYVEEAIKEFGVSAHEFDLFRAIGMGQYSEKCEVFNIVRNFLEGLS